jgi:hypothetical protein
MLAYYGFDGLRGNHNLKKMSLEEVEKYGVGNSRYLEVSNCYALGSFVHEYDKKRPDNVENVIFPIVSKKTFHKYLESEALQMEDASESDTARRNIVDLQTTLIVKRSKAKFSSGCAKGDGTCLDDLLDFDSEQFMKSGFSIKGVTLVGLDDVDSETKSLIQRLDYKMGTNVLLLEEDAEPRGSLPSILMLIGGILGLLAVGASFFRK